MSIPGIAYGDRALRQYEASCSLIPRRVYLIPRLLPTRVYLIPRLLPAACLTVGYGGSTVPSCYAMSGTAMFAICFGTAIRYGGIRSWYWRDSWY
eukprot:2700235-Rhodomonas_salina.2